MIGESTVFQLLEQALIVEEQLKRATLMGVQQDNNHPAMSLQSRYFTITHDNIYLSF